MLRRVLAEKLEHLGFEASILDLDVQKTEWTVAMENIFEQWQKTLFLPWGQIPRAGPGQADAAKVRVVAYDRNADRSTTNVKFKTIATMLEAEVKRRKRIFWDRNAGTGTAMAQEQGPLAIHEVPRDRLIASRTGSGRSTM